MCAGQHLVHVASAAGEEMECERGWLGRRKRWHLPPELRTVAEVCPAGVEGSLRAGQTYAVTHALSIRFVGPTYYLE